MNYAYIKTDLSDAEIAAQKKAIGVYAVRQGIKLDDYIMQAKFHFDGGADKKDVVLIADASKLGGSVCDVYRVLEQYLSDLIFIFVAENIVLDLNAAEAISFINGLNIMLRFRSSIQSVKTRGALNNVKNSGRRLGNRKGIRLFSKMQRCRPEVEKLLRQGVTLVKIAEQVGCSYSGLLNFIKKENLRS